MHKNITFNFSDKRLFNNKFTPLLKNTKRYIFLLGGAGSGKSFFQSQKEIIKSFECKGNIMCVRKVRDTIKDSMYAELKKRIYEWKLQDYFSLTKSPLSIINKVSGVEFIFRGIDDPEKIKSVSNIERIWIEEATELSREDFDQIDLRMRGQKNMQLTCTFNPTDAEHWLNKDFWINGNTEDVECLHSTFTDNDFIGSEYKSVLERMVRTNRNYYNIYALGKWGVLDGLVFENGFETIKEIPEEAKLLSYGLDFGFTNDPSSLVALYRYDNSIILDEIFYQTRMLNSDIIDELKKQPFATVWADSAEPKSIEEIKRAGIEIKPVTKGADSIVYGIDTMKQNKIILTSRSGNGQKEMRKYVWAKDKHGKPTNNPIDSQNHFIDASRYACMMTLSKPVEYEIFFG